MKLSAFSSVIKSMFTDRMSINRYVTITNSDGTTDTILPEIPIYQDVPCRLSFSTEENPASLEVDETAIKLIPKIFCAMDVDIRAADMLIVKRIGDSKETLATYSGIGGLPSMYTTHQEILFSIRESA